MNDIRNIVNGDVAVERPTRRVERQDRTHRPDIDESVDSLESSPYRRARVTIIVVLWVLQYCATSILVWIAGETPAESLYGPRLLVTAGNLAISFGILAVQDRLGDYGLKLRGIVALLLGIIAPAIGVLMNYLVFYQLCDFSYLGVPTAIDLIQDYLMRFWIFGSMSAIILALSYAADIREREQRIHSLQALAHSAQLTALRNQLNPHFLFNALNSIAGLMRGRRSVEAETMTENLADFLRTTLALDPQLNIALSDELRLQQLYLAIERVRFPDRLDVDIDVPAELQHALIPSLITQPLIENSIKYAVSRSMRPVRLKIHARREEDSLVLTIADDGGDAEPSRHPSSRLGLRNIAERLAVHFGERASLEAGPTDDGGFSNRLVIPLNMKASS